MKRFVFAAVLSAALPACALAQQAAAPPGKPTVAPDGTVSGSLTVPLSQHLSEAAKAQYRARMNRPPSMSMKDGIAAVRANSAKMAKERLDAWLALRPATVTSEMIDGVRVDVVVPQGGVDPANRGRVLINAHSGGFFTGGEYGGALEAVPLATTGKVKVIAVDYRMSPEHVFPAASEDMATIYRHVLKTTRPENVGLYGCSAGGTLAAQAVAWFAKEGLPRPGAIGVFCAGAMQTFWYGGDGGAVTPFLNGGPPVTPGVRAPGSPRDYFDGIDQNDPLIAPAEFPATLAAFPPTLV
ncbi:MAG: alpha/beta hydrolase fold domain-containing protein [Rhodospirillaceae bacterium]|nr:alpha/beta hydrolase fold domain-containing protein [Rhodospirillaceae bacterium]